MAISPRLIDNTPDYYDLPQKMNNKGILYEAFLYETLKDKGLIPRGFTPAASDSNAPDIKFMWKGNSYNLEVKLDERADFGQSGLKYRNAKWELDGNSAPAHVSMREMLRRMGIEDFVNSRAGWGGLGQPRLFKLKEDNLTPTWADKQDDYDKFQDKYIPIPNTTVTSYYKGKNINYIHIGGLGTYYMGGDPAQMIPFTNIPRFQADLKLRIRKKGSSSNPNYRFSLALLLASTPNESEFNISDDASIEILTSNQ
tara:strand:+ start:39 stop:803 length:765 start_codon:yes stop_codon:yes gene_type:complete